MQASIFMKMGFQPGQRQYDVVSGHLGSWPLGHTGPNLHLDGAVCLLTDLRFLPHLQNGLGQRIRDNIGSKEPSRMSDMFIVCFETHPQIGWIRPAYGD